MCASVTAGARAARARRCARGARSPPLPSSRQLRKTPPLSPPPPQLLKKCEKIATKAEALRQLVALASGAHFLPGEPGWPVGGVIAAPKSSLETGARAARHIPFLSRLHYRHALTAAILPLAALPRIPPPPARREPALLPQAAARGPRAALRRPRLQRRRLAQQVLDDVLEAQVPQQGVPLSAR